MSFSQAFCWHLPPRRYHHSPALCCLEPSKPLLPWAHVRGPLLLTQPPGIYIPMWSAPYYTPLLGIFLLGSQFLSILSFSVVTRRWSSWQSGQGSSRSDREYGEDMYVLEWVTTNLFILEASGHFQASTKQCSGLWAAELTELHPHYAIQWVEPWSSFVCENWNNQF